MCTSTAPAPDAGNGPDSVASCLRNFFSLQELRAQAYSDLDRVFKEYLVEWQENSYRLGPLIFVSLFGLVAKLHSLKLSALNCRPSMSASTPTPHHRDLLSRLAGEFQLLSQRVVALEATLLNPLSRHDLAALLRSVQEGEREKLQLTLAVQSLRALKEREQPAWRGVGSAGENPDAVGATPSHVCGSGCGHAKEISASKAEVEAALGESVRALEAAVVGINDVMDEAREALLEEECEGR
jgi:hypothetical protein